MIFYAIPSLRESQRNNERETEVAGVAASLVTYIAQNRGIVPSQTDWDDLTFQSSFWNGVYVDTGSRETDPENGLYRDIIDSDTAGYIEYRPGEACDGNGFQNSVDQFGFAMRVKLEGNGSYCVDSE